MATADNKAARRAGLRYLDDSGRGIRRKRKNGQFEYMGARGSRVRAAKTLVRIRSLAIPPAWTDVWISPHANSHLQATGRDARGRKQYRYHPRWRAERDQNKFDHLIAFAKSLPRIRRKVGRDLRRRGLPREKILAAIVRLLETSLIRVGNEEYSRSNNSFGLTTMRDGHATVRGSTIQFRFRGKSGIKRKLDLNSPVLAKIVRRCQELPGQQLFQYLDDEGRVCDVGSSDVNEYLRRIAGQEISTKDFRTWAGTALAAKALEGFESFDTEARGKRNILRAIERVASRLGNTPSVCRKCYIHPAVIDAYMDRSLADCLQRRSESELRKGLHSLPGEEAAVLALLQQRLKRRGLKNAHSL